jgi:hypothetical protein
LQQQTSAEEAEDNTFLGKAKTKAMAAKEKALEAAGVVKSAAGEVK